MLAHSQGGLATEISCIMTGLLDLHPTFHIVLHSIISSMWGRNGFDMRLMIGQVVMSCFDYVSDAELQAVEDAFLEAVAGADADQVFACQGLMDRYPRLMGKHD